MNAIESISKGGASRRKSVAALACVLALAMVACAVVVALPGDNNYEVDAATSEIPTDADHMKTINDGETIFSQEAGVYYVITGSVTVVADGGAVNVAAGTDPVTPAKPNAGVILKEGASITIEGSGAAADIIKVYAATSPNAFNSDKYITITGAVLTQAKEYTVTITCDALGSLTIATDNLVGSEKSSAAEFQLTVAANTDASVSGVIKTAPAETNADTISNLGFAYSTEETVGTNLQTVYNGAAPAEPIAIGVNNTTKYTVLTTPIAFEATVGTGNAAKNIEFTVAASGRLQHDAQFRFIVEIHVKRNRCISRAAATACKSERNKHTQ